MDGDTASEGGNEDSDDGKDAEEAIGGAGVSEGMLDSERDDCIGSAGD